LNNLRINRAIATRFLLCVSVIELLVPLGEVAGTVDCMLKENNILCFKKTVAGNFGVKATASIKVTI
jgi:hypothetical protein